MDSAMISVGELSVSASAIATDESSAGASDGQIEVTVSGGTASYTVALSGGASPPSQSIPTSGGSTTFMSLPAGTYTVDVTDNAGCTTQLTGVVVSTTPLVSFNATLTPLRCASDDAQIDVVVDTMTGTAPYTIRLTGVISGVQTVMASAATFTMLEADQYTVEVSDAVVETSPDEESEARAPDSEAIVDEDALEVEPSDAREVAEASEDAVSEDAAN